MDESVAEVSMPWTYNDGGYSTSGFRAKHGNGVVRAIAIGTGQSYGWVYDSLYRRQVEFVERSRSKLVRKKGPAISHVGVWPEVSKAYLLDQGWTWRPTMAIGSGVTMHLDYEEVPDLPLFIARVSRSLVTVVNGIAQDIDDPSRDGSRAVYGYFTSPA